MGKSIWRILILIVFFCANKAGAQNIIKWDHSVFFENYIDSLSKQFNRDITLFKNSDDYYIDSSSFLQNFKKHRMKMSLANESFVDSYMDSINRIQYIYYESFNTAEEYSIMFASLLYCNSAIDLEWICLNFSYMLYFYPNKICIVEKYANMLGKKFSENFSKILAYICAEELYEKTLIEDPKLFRMFYPYFYSKFGDKPYELAVKSDPDDWIDDNCFIIDL